MGPSVLGSHAPYSFQFFIHKLSLGAHFLVPNLNSNATKQDVSLGSGCIKLFPKPNGAFFGWLSKHDLQLQ